GRTFVQVVINHGRAAGASIEHPHAQIVALDLVPPAVAQAVERFGAAGHDPVVADLDGAGDDLRLLDGPVAALSHPGGRTPFEQGTGILVNTVPPEVAAEQLRDAAGESS